MRFMMLMIPKGYEDAAPGTLPDAPAVDAMMKYNEELVKAGLMLAGEGLQASSKGKRVKFTGRKTSVIDGPFAETKELVAGFWIWKVNSRQEAIDWLKRAPFDQTEVEIRQLAEAEDFEPAIKTQEGVETLAKESAFRAQQQTKH